MACLEQGRLALKTEGIPQTVVNQYWLTQALSTKATRELLPEWRWYRQLRQRNRNRRGRRLSSGWQSTEGHAQTLYRMGETMVIVIRAEFPNEVNNPTFGVNIVTDSGIRVADCRSNHYGVEIGTVKGIVEYRVRINSLELYPRSYSVEPWVANASCTSDYDWVTNATEFEVSSGPNFMGGANVNSSHGVMYIPTSWEVYPVCDEYVANVAADHHGAQT